MRILGIIASAFSGTTAISQYIAVAGSTSPYITVYPWSLTSGFGTKIADPVSPITSAAWGVDFNTDSTTKVINDVVIGTQSLPFVYGYSWNNGFGSKYADPVTAYRAYGLKFNSTKSYVVCSNLSTSNTRGVSAISWNSGFGTISVPSSNAGGTGYEVDFKKSTTGASDYVFVASGSSPNISAYPFPATSGFGTKVANPTTLPPNDSRGVSFQEFDSYVAIASQTSPYISAYVWTGSAWGAKYSNPASLPVGGGYGIGASYIGDYIALGHASTPFITVYNFTSTSGFGTKVTNPTTLPIGIVYEVFFHNFDEAISFAISGSPHIITYRWISGSGFSTKYADPATLPAGNSLAGAFGG